MRSYKYSAIQAWDESGLGPLPMPCQKIRMDDLNTAVRRYDLHSNLAGQGSGMLASVRPAAEIFDDLMTGTIQAPEQTQSAVEFSA